MLIQVTKPSWRNTLIGYKDIYLGRNQESAN